MTLQTTSQLVLAIGIILSALGGLGSYYFGKVEEKDREEKSRREQDALKEQITSLQAMTSKISEQNELILQTTKGKDKTWMEVEMKRVPAGVADYLLLLFASDKGRISGKVRIKGSDDVTSFSTTANNRRPIALRNLWVPAQNQYKVPTIMEFTITEKTDPNASLEIYTQGYIDSRGAEPH